jgi:hypothetical protein
MKKEDKELLLEDLCGRLPYGVKCQVQEDEFTYIGTLCRIEVDNENGHLLDFTESMCGLNCQVYLSEVKPYLFPLSSMTEEQYEKFIIISGWDVDIEDIRRGKFSCIGYVGLDCMYDAIDWFNKNHFDYRGLIERGLAIDASSKYIYYICL